MKKPSDEQTPNAAHLNPDSDLPPDADLEERFNDFWKKNGTSIFATVALGALIVVGTQGYQYWNQKKEESIRAEFSTLEDIEAKIQFAEAHPEHNLGGMALLEAADARYESGKYEEAAKFYAESKEILKGSLLDGRAQLGEGMSYLMLGQKESGEAVLSGLALNNSMLNQIRGEAAYNLAVSRWEAGNKEGAEEALEIIFAMENAGFWSYRATSLQDRISGTQS